MKLNLDDALVVVSALIAFSTSILVFAFPSYVIIMVEAKIVSREVPLYYLFLTTIGSVSALVGVAISKKGIVARVLMIVGNILILIHSAIGLLGYYDVIPHLIAPKGLIPNWSVQTVYTPFIGIAIFGLIILFLSLIIWFSEEEKKRIGCAQLIFAHIKETVHDYYSLSF